MGSQDFPPTQKTASKRSSNLEDEETDKMLGYSKHRSNDAVSIAKPGNKNHAYRASGGPRPMNTLTTSPNLPNQTYSAKIPPSKSRNQGLSVQVSRGSNVGDARVIEVEDSFEKPPSAKRQKTNHSDSRSAGESSDSTINEVPPSQITFARQPEKPSSTPLLSNRARKAEQHNIEAVDEFRSVEGIMDSNPRNAKRNRAAAATRQKTASPLMAPFSRNNSFEVLGEGEPSGPSNTRPAETRYQGTIRQQPEIAQTNGVNGNAHTLHGQITTSQYFKQTLHDQPKESERSLRSSFVASDGKTRGMDRLSSDELEGPATLGEHADVIPLSPRKARHLPDPGSPRPGAGRPTKSSTRETPMERSNIKPTIFQTQRPSKGKSGRRGTFEDQYLDESESQWAVPIAAINIPGEAEMRVSSSMGIVYDEDEKRYFVKDCGRPFKAPNASAYGVNPRILQKCWREKFGKKIRFQSSKSGTDDNLLDVELASEKDVAELLLKIQGDSTNVKVFDEEGTKMQRWFDNRRRQSKASSPAIPGIENMPEDVQMVARNRHRQEIREQQTREAGNNTRRRSRITDSLTDNTTSESASFGLVSRNTSIEKSNSSSTRTNGKDNNDTYGRSRIFDKVRPSHNDHLRRSTRTSSGHSRFFGEPAEPEPPKAERYSVKFGLGDKWSKPLSFPKTGKKKATVEWDDLERLDEGEFLNDNLVSFYMRYLEEELTNHNRDLAKTVYFFNSFFYDRLTTNQRGQKGINYEGVQRWTRGVDLFAYDFVIVPINEHSHWYVAIICNLPALDEQIGSAEGSSPPAEAADKQLNGELQESVLNGNEQQPGEKEARQSFAELSLEGKPEKRQVSEDSLMGSLDQIKAEEKVAPKDDEDEEMLDRPVAAEYGNLHAESAKEEDDPDPEADDVRKSPTMTKKQKRKSMPPTITKFDPSSPSIITFDSFGNPHSQVIKTLKQYLYEEGKAKRSIELDVSSIKGITAKNIPQQSNFSDCGLFMLGYVEKFLQDRPRNFIAKIIKREYDDQKDWSKMVPSTMRSDLREQLQNLHAEDVDERRAAAVKAGKLEPALQGQQAAPPPAKEEVRHPGEAASVERVKSDDEGLPAISRADPPVDVQQPPNVEDASLAITEDSRFESTSKMATDAVVSDTGPDASLIIIGSHQEHPEVATEKEQPDIPSSQFPPQSPTPGHDMVGSSPTLPNEIEDSQPSHQYPRAADPGHASPPSIPARPTSHQPNEIPEDLALSPVQSGARQDPPSPHAEAQQQQQQQEQLPDQLYSKMPQKPKVSETTNENPKVSPSSSHGTSKRRARKGVATYKATNITTSSFPSSSTIQRGGGGGNSRNGTKKMTKEEAIVLDD